MKRGSGAQGYTILEVMIVLAVSSALLTGAMVVISSQRQKTEFSQAVREIELQIQDVINDVSTGYYANTGNFRCRANNGRPLLEAVAAGGDQQGANQDCIFLGRAMQFGVADSDGEAYNILNVVGLRQIVSGGQAREVQTLAEAKPTAIAPAATGASTPDATERRELQYGLRIMSIRAGGQQFGGVGFFGSLAPYSAVTGNLASGAQTVDVVAIPGSALNMSERAMVNSINTMDSVSTSTLSTVTNPTGGITLCFQSGGTNEYGEITIGGSSGRLTTTLRIEQGVCSVG